MSTWDGADSHGSRAGSGVEELPPALALSPRQFWGMFTLGWVAFFGLTFFGLTG